MASERWSDRHARPSGCAVILVAGIVSVSVAWTSVLHAVNGWAWVTPW